MPISTTHIWISLDTSLFFFTVFLRFNKKSDFITQKSHGCFCIHDRFYMGNKPSQIDRPLRLLHSSSPDSHIQGRSPANSPRLLRFTPMADFHLRIILYVYSGGTVHDFHMILYSLSAAVRDWQHYACLFYLIPLYLSRFFHFCLPVIQPVPSETGIISLSIHTFLDPLLLHRYNGHRLFSIQNQV